MDNPQPFAVSSSPYDAIAASSLRGGIHMRHALPLALGFSFLLAGCAEDEKAAAPANNEPVTRLIELVEHADAEIITDVGMMGDSVGDIFTFSNPVFDKTNTTQVGTDQGYCIRIKAGEAWECEWTVFLMEGQITVTGPFYDAKESTLSVTGGTGEFKNASGEMKLGFRTPPPPEIEYDFIYNLILED
jgi:allene oxide cyclase